MCAPYVRFLAISPTYLHTRLQFGTTFETIPFREWTHELKRGFMITKQAIIEDDLAEIEKILEEYWITEEDRFRSILNGLDEAKV